MKDNFIKGFLYKEIYRNEINGYMVGLFKIKDNNIDYDDDMIHITGILPRLSEKKEYILYGEIVYHNKYGKQFNVNSFEVNIPTKEEELIVFLSSDLFPIGEKTAKKIVDTFHEDTINKILENKDCLQLIPRLGENKINRIYIVACGTAMHAGLVGKSAIEKLCKIPTEVDIASEFRYRDPIIDDKTLCIYISQSGETADTIAALKLAKAKGAKTLAVSNVIGSSITREADYTIYTHAGPEIAVASTKAYTSQVILMVILAVYFAEVLGSCDENYIEELKSDIIDLPAKVETILDEINTVKEFANKVYTEHDMYFLGRGTDYNVAMEGSLKLKEISYIHSEAYASGELKHGPIALIENGVTVISILTNPDLVEKSISNIQEVITRGAKTLVITNQKLPNNSFNYIINIPDTNSLISPILSVIPLQLLAYYIAKNKGLDVDKPRNLAKSVTVE